MKFPRWNNKNTKQDNNAQDESKLSKIQKLINDTNAGGTLKLTPPKQEYQGPIVIKKPIVIDGEHSSFWAKEEGPVLEVQSSGVVLKNLNVEITGNEKNLSEDKACAIIVKKGVGITLNNVSVRGNVLGLDDEEGDWLYPRSIRLTLKSGQQHEFKIKVSVPVDCKLKSEIAGLSIKPQGLKGGQDTEITLKLDPLSKGVRLDGRIVLKTSLLCRNIEVRGHVTDAVSSEDACKIKYWSTLNAQSPPSQPKADTKSLTEASNSKKTTSTKTSKTIDESKAKGQPQQESPRIPDIPDKVEPSEKKPAKPIEVPDVFEEQKKNAPTTTKKKRSFKTTSIPLGNAWGNQNLHDDKVKDATEVLHVDKVEHQNVSTKEDASSDDEIKAEDKLCDKSSSNKSSSKTNSKRSLNKIKKELSAFSGESDNAIQKSVNNESQEEQSLVKNQTDSNKLDIKSKKRKYVKLDDDSNVSDAWK